MFQPCVRLLLLIILVTIDFDPVESRMRRIGGLSTNTNSIQWTSLDSTATREGGGIKKTDDSVNIENMNARPRRALESSIRSLKSSGHGGGAHGSSSSSSSSGQGRSNIRATGPRSTFGLSAMAFAGVIIGCIAATMIVIGVIWALVCGRIARTREQRLREIWKEEFKDEVDRVKGIVIDRRKTHNNQQPRNIKIPASYISSYRNHRINVNNINTDPLPTVHEYTIRFTDIGGYYLITGYCTDEYGVTSTICDGQCNYDGFAYWVQLNGIDDDSNNNIKDNTNDSDDYYDDAVLIFGKFVSQFSSFKGSWYISKSNHKGRYDYFEDKTKHKVYEKQRVMKQLLEDTTKSSTSGDFEIASNLYY